MGRPDRAWVLPGIVVVLFATVPVISGFARPLVSQDEMLLLVYPEHVLNGAVPNRDFFTVYGPGAFWAIAAVFWLAEPSVFVERLVGVVYHVVLALGVMRLTRHWGMWWAAAAGICSGLVMLPLSVTAYAWVGGLALVVWSVGVLSGGSGRSAMLAGILGALSCLWRPELSIVFVAASVPYLVRSGRFRTWAAGVLAGLLPMIVHVAVAGPELFRNVVLDRMTVGNAGLGVPTDEPLTMLFLGVTLLAALALCVIAAIDRTRRSFSMAILVVLLLPQMLQRIDVPHIAYVACVAVPVAGVEVAARAVRARPGLASRLAHRRVRLGLAATGAYLLAVSVVASAVVVAMEPQYAAVAGTRSVPVETSVHKAQIEEFIASVRTHVPAGGTVFVGAQDMSVPTVTPIHLYHLLPEYTWGSYYLELAPGVSELPGSRLADDVADADALVLYRIPAATTRALFPYLPPGDDTVNRLVDREFCRVAVSGPWELRTRC